MTAAVLGVSSLFWSLYFLRLLVVTHALTRVRGGGWGAFIGAVAFPALAVALGFAARWAARRARGAPTDSPHSTR